MTQQGPNPQTNMILSIVAPVVALIAFAIIYFTRPVPVPPAPPAQVNVAASALPANSVVMSNALPNSGTASGGSASGGPGGPPAAAGGRGGGGFVPGAPPSPAGTAASGGGQKARGGGAAAN